MDDRSDAKLDAQLGVQTGSDGPTPTNVVELNLSRRRAGPEASDPRLEEIRRILTQSEPLYGFCTDDEVIAS